MANPFEAAARGQAIRRFISMILSGKERDIAREDELGEIERRMKQERWQQSMAERGLGLEERRVAEAERAGPAGEALTGLQQALMERLAGREQEGLLSRHLLPSGTAQLPYLGMTEADRARIASREAIARMPFEGRTAESQYMFGRGEGELTPPAGVAPGTPPGLWGQYPKPPAPMEGGFAGLPAGPTDPRRAGLLLELLRHREPSGGERLRADEAGRLSPSEERLREKTARRAVDDYEALFRAEWKDASRDVYNRQREQGKPVRLSPTGAQVQVRRIDTMPTAARERARKNAEDAERFLRSIGKSSHFGFGGLGGVGVGGGAGPGGAGGSIDEMARRHGG